MAVASPTEGPGTWPQAPFPYLATSCPSGETWDLDGHRGLRTESRGHQPTSDSLPSSHGQMSLPGPVPSCPGVSRLYVSPPDRHCEQKTAGREQTRYLFSHNLWVGVAPRGQERVACSAASHTYSLSPSPSVTSLNASLVFPISLPACASFSWPTPRLCHPSENPRST